MNNNKAGFYLLCDLGVPGDEATGEPKYFRINLPKANLCARSVFLLDKKQSIPTSISDCHNGRFVFWFRDGSRDDERAQTISDALLANIELLYQIAVVGPHESPKAYWLERSMFCEDVFLKKDQFIKTKPSLYIRLNRSVTFPRSTVKSAWTILPITLQQPYFDAVHFYQASIREYCFIGDSIGEVLNGYLKSPTSRSDYVRAENAVLNAFKAIEAIIGDPPKNEAKYRQKLEKVGISPDELVGFTGYSGIEGKQPIGNKIRKFNYLRDKKAAHGRSAIDRRITFYEIMDIQACAQAVIQIAINTARKNAT